MKQLYKSNTNKKVAGVCGGIGEYLGIDPTIVRLGFVALSLLAGGGLAVYIIAAIIMTDKKVYDALVARHHLLHEGYRVVRYLLFSASGFSDWLMEEAKNGVLQLIQLEDMYQIPANP